MSSSNMRTSWILVVLGALSLALPTLISFYPPMSDLALHEGIIGLLAHLGEPDFTPHSLYRLNLGHPNQLFHFISAAIATLTDTRIAVKIVVASTQILLILGAARLAQRAGKNPLLGLLASPMALGWFFYWGLITNMLGLALLCVALPFLVTTARTVATPALFRAFAWFVLLFLAHETAFFLGVGFFFVLACISARSIRHIVRALALCMMGGAIALIHLRYQARFFAKNLLQPPPDFPTLGHRAARLMDSLFGTHPLHVWVLQGIFCSLIAALLLAPRTKHASPKVKRSLLVVGSITVSLLVLSFVATRTAEDDNELRFVRFVSMAGALVVALFTIHVFDGVNAFRSALSNVEERERLRRSMENSPYLVLGALLFAAFWLIPFNWKGSTLLYERALAPSFLLLGIGLAPRRLLPRMTKLALCGMPLVILATGLPQFAEASRLARDLQPVIERIPRGQAIAMIQVASGEIKGRTFSPQTISMRALAERGGRAGLQLTDSPIAVVTMVPELRWERFALRLWTMGADLRLPHDIEMFSYVLAHVSEPMPQFVLRLAMKPYATHVVTSGEWMLFRSSYPPRAIDLPELPAGIPPSQRLPDLCQSIADGMVDELRSKSWDTGPGQAGVPPDFIP